MAGFLRVKWTVKTINQNSITKLRLISITSVQRFVNKKVIQITNAYKTIVEIRRGMPCIKIYFRQVISYNAILVAQNI